MISSPALANPVMLARRLEHFPRARQAGSESDEIAFAEAHRRPAVRRDDYIALQQVAHLPLVILPGKLRNFLRPNFPTANIQFVESLSIRIAFDLHLVHGVKDSSSFLISVSFPSGLDSVKRGNLPPT